MKGLLLKIIGFVLLPALVYLAGYRLTGLYFRAKLLPYPFESFGFAVGLAAAAWFLSLLFFICWLAQRKRRLK